MRTRRRPLRPLAASVALVALLGACGGDGNGDEAVPTTTTVPDATSTSVPPDQAFDQALTDQLDGLDATFIGGSRAAGHTLCDNLTALAADGDTAVEGGPTAALLVGAVFDGFTQPAVAAVVLRATAEHLCPEHTDVVEQVLVAEGQ